MSPSTRRRKSKKLLESSPAVSIPAGSSNGKRSKSSKKTGRSEGEKELTTEKAPAPKRAKKTAVDSQCRFVGETIPAEEAKKRCKKKVDPLNHQVKLSDFGSVKILDIAMTSGASKTRSCTRSTTTPQAGSKSQSQSQPSSQSQLPLQSVWEPSVHPTTPTTASSSKIKRGRGRTRGLSLQRLTCGGAKVPVDFPEGCIRPVGDNAKEFTTEVGILCRSMIPASTPRWSAVTDVDRQCIYQCLEDKFEIDMSDAHIKYAVNDMMKERLQEYRAELHRHYKRFGTHVEAVQNALGGVTVDEWRILCERFGSEKFQKRSKINSKNRAKLIVNHVAGSKSFVRHRYEMRDPETGQERSEVDHYKDVHYQPQTGAWVHPLAGEHWEEMELRRSQPTPDGTQRSEPEIMSEVLGMRSGYVRGLGHGAKLIAPARSGSSRGAIEESIRRRAEAAERENQQLRVQIDELRETVMTMKTEIVRRMEAEIARRMEAEIVRRMEEIRVQHERRMQEMFQSLAAHF